MRNQSGQAPERKTIMSAFRDRTAIAVDFRHIGKKLGSVRRRLKRKRGDRTLPINHNDSGGADLTKSSRKADLAFQRA